MPISIEQGQRSDAIRIAPSYIETKLLAGAQLPSGAYTVEALAKFLGEVGSDGRPHAGFRAMFGALELLSEGYLTEAQIKGSTSRYPFRWRNASLRRVYGEQPCEVCSQFLKSVRS
jgi:hypothetical protein